jgi:SAM-dependent methyltransferase
MWNSGWDNIFKENEWGKYPPEELVRFVARSFGKSGDKKKIAILEVGCGPGANLWYLAREGYDTYGIDGSHIAVNRAKERLIKDGLKAEIVAGDVLTLPFPDAKFDCVLDVECLYANSLKDTKVILGEIKRVLKPGGLFFSKTFMTGTYGDGKGEILAGEPHTYIKLEESALHKGYGIIRFTSKDELGDLYSIFKIVNVDYIIRSDKNSKYEIKEWLISCQKI